MKRLLRRTILSGIGILTFAACVPSAESNGGMTSTEDACGAAALQAFVGQSVDSYDFRANHPKVRIIPHGAAVTTDYDPERLNVTLTPDRLIDRISCG